ncbi:hypothetical protein GCM10018965_082760 [Nonomuraea roseola]
MAPALGAVSSSTRPLCERAQQFHHARSGAGVDRQEPRVADDGAGGGDALPLAARHLVRTVAEPMPEPHPLQRPGGPQRRPHSEGPSGAAIRHVVRRRYPGWSLAGITVREGRPGVW